MMERKQARVRRAGAWRFCSFVLPFVFAVMLLAFGFGLGSACTDRPGHPLLSEPPCNRVTQGVTLNTIAQVLLGAVAVATARTTRLTRSIVVASVVVFVVSLVLALSY
jgi:hypothetical protein